MGVFINLLCMGGRIDIVVFLGIKRVIFVRCK